MKVREIEAKIEKCFSEKKLLEVADFVEICEICEVPKVLKEVLFNKIDVNKTGKVEKQQFVSFYKREFEREPIAKKRTFITLCKPKVNYIEPDDF